MTERLLTVDNLVTKFRIEDVEICAVDNVSFSIDKGQTVGLVGESGCGKSVTALSILQLIQSPPGFIDSGRIMLEDHDLLKYSEHEMRKIRGNRISMVFQEPMTSLNPVFTIGNQVSEVFRIHHGSDRKEAWKKSIDMLRLVKMPAPEKRIEEYPHQLSGGMRQRVMIAMALACRPQLLIADEPTTALDVTIQAQILDLMADLQKELNMAILLITHDLGVVSEVCDYVLVMYAGKIVEEAPVDKIFDDPQHPYTAGLLESIPRLGQKVDILPTIDGTVPDLDNLPKGCRFQERCSKVMDRCRQQEPELVQVTKSQKAACWLHEK